MSDLCPTPCCQVGWWKTELLAQANSTLIDIQLSVGMQHMEELVNKLPFQCQNRVPYQGGEVGMALEVVISGREEKQLDTDIVADVAL